MKSSNIVRRFGESIIKWVYDTSPTYVFLATVLLGFLLIISSYLLDIHSVQILCEIDCDEKHREVGYFYAINWSLNYAIFFPFALYFMIKSLQSVLNTLKALSNLKMARNQHYNTIDVKEITDLWQKRSESSISLVIIVALVLAISMSFGEWYLENFRPLMIQGYEPVKSALDWGVGVLIRGGEVVSIENVSFGSRVSNLIFDLVCYTYQALLIFSLITYFVLMTGFSMLFAKDFEAAGIFLIPNIESNDKRRGFEEFEPILTEMLFAALFAYILAYLSRLQNVFLHCPSTSSLLEFVRKDLVMGFFSSGKLQPFSLQAPCPNSLPMDLPDILIVSSTLLVILALLMIVMLTLRNTAETAKNRLCRTITEKRDLSKVTNRTKEDIENRLKEMEIWPMKFPKFNVLLTLCVLGIATIWFYKIGLFILGIILAVLIKRFVSELKEAKK